MLGGLWSFVAGQGSGVDHHDKRLAELGYSRGAHVEIVGLKKQDFLFLTGQTAKVIGMQLGTTGAEQILVKLDDEAGRATGNAYALKPGNVSPLSIMHVTESTVSTATPTRVRQRGGATTSSSAAPRSQFATSPKAGDGDDFSDPPARNHIPVARRDIVADAASEGSALEWRLWSAFFFINVVLSGCALYTAQSASGEGARYSRSLGASPAAPAASSIREIVFANSSSEAWYVRGSSWVDRARQLETSALEIGDKIRNAGAPILDFYVLDRALLDDVVLRKNSGCKWLPTTMCSPYGHGQSKQGRACDEKVSVINSGICFCGGSLIFGKACGGRMHQETFTCAEVCEKREAIVSWSVNSNADPKAVVDQKATDVPGMAKVMPSGKHPSIEDLVSAANFGTDPKVAMVTVLMGSESPTPFYRMIMQYHQRSHNDVFMRNIVVFVPPDSKSTSLHATIKKDLEGATHVWAKRLQDLITFVPIEKRHWVMPATGEITDAALREAVLEGMRDTPFKLARFFAFYFQTYPQMMPFEYFWRIHESSILLCDLPYDPIRVLRNYGKALGFNHATRLPIPSVETITKDMDAMPKKDPDFYRNMRRYGMCTLDPSFIAGELDWMRTDAYADAASKLSTSSWMASSWGESSFLTVMATLRLRQDQLHFFEAIGSATGKTLVHIPTDNTACIPSFPSVHSDLACISLLSNLSSLGSA